MLFVHIQQAINKVATGSAKVDDRDKLLTCQLYRIEKLEHAVHEKIERLRLDGVASQQIRDEVLAMIKATDKKETPTGDQSNQTSVNKSQTEQSNEG